MGVYTSPVQLQRAQQRKFAKMVLNQRTVHGELMNEAQKDYASGTGGGVSEQTLRQMGHPFAREGAAARGIRAIDRAAKWKYGGKVYSYKATNRKGKIKTVTKFQVSKGIIQPLPINKQSGALRRSFKRRGSFEITYMGFTAPHAKYVLSPQGTKKMVARGFYSKRQSITDLGWLARRHRARAGAAIRALRQRQRGLN